MTRSGNNHIRFGYSTPPIVAKWCIWSVVNQSWLAGQIRIYIWGAMALVAVFTLTGFISPETALISMFISGSIIAAAILLLIRQRRIWLLHIREPELRRRALAAMTAYLNAVRYPLPRRLHDSAIGDGNPEEEADCRRIR